MVNGLIGKKIGMTQLFDVDGTVHPATVLKAGPCVVAQVKTVERDGYEAVQLGFVDAATKENKPTQGHFKKAGVPATRITREVKLKTGGDPVKAGDQISVSMFADGDRVDVVGTSRGKGFQGVVKRHHFKGGRATHGSMFHRAPGSIGASSYPSRVVKGMRMGGHIAAKKIKVAQVEPVKKKGKK
jgi:large subunit ribosomal protein L3